MSSQGLSTRTISRVFFTVLALVALTYLAYQVRQVLVLVFTSIFLAVALGPAVASFQKSKLPRPWAIFLVYLATGAGVFVVGLLVIPPIVEQIQMFVDDVPDYVKDIRENETLREYDDKYHITKGLLEQVETLPSRLGSAAGALAAITVGAFSAILKLVTVLVITFFLLLDGGRTVNWILAQLGEEKGIRYRRIAEDVYGSTSAYVGASLAIALFAGITSYFVLLALGIPFAVPLAVLMTFMSLIPMIGATIAGGLILIVALFHNFPTAAIIWGIYFLVYQQVENNLIQPVVYKRIINLHPLIVIISILVGGSLLGILGALVAIPTAAAILIVIKDLWEYRTGKVALPLAGPLEPPEPEPEPG